MIDDIGELARTLSGREMLERLAKIDEQERRRHVGPVRDLFSQWFTGRYSTSAKAVRNPPALRDEDALKIAWLGSATRSELRPHFWAVLPQHISIAEVMRILRPSWLDGWVDDLITDRPAIADKLAPLWREGLCRRPEGDSRILAYYSAWHDKTYPDHPEFIDEDVWRFFEVEGGGDMSLAAYDKYCKKESWADRLLHLSSEGKLDRQRLLDASLDALERDFGQFRAGWYSRFHLALAPSLEEQERLRERYLNLLSSNVPATVSLALKGLKSLDKAGKLPADELLANISPALVATQKSAASDALQLLASAAKRQPGLSADIAGAALSALISKSGEIQSKALDLVERLGQTEAPHVQALLAEYATAVQPSVRNRLKLLVRGPAHDDGYQRVEPSAQTGPSFARLDCCVSVDEAIAEYLMVLEDARDPLQVERAMDGLSRFGRDVFGNVAPLSPVAKRSRQRFEKAGYELLDLVIAACGRAWCGEGRPSHLISDATGSPGFRGLSNESVCATFLLRCDEIYDRVSNGVALPLLSLPSDESGRIDPAEFVERLASYRAINVEPGAVDLALALLRLDANGRETARDSVTTIDQAGRVAAFALGALNAVEGTGPLWAAAWLSRPDRDQIDWPSSAPEPDAGVPASFKLELETGGKKPYRWCHPRVRVTPELKSPSPLVPGSLLHFRHGQLWMTSSALDGGIPGIAWGSLIRPDAPEAFMATAVCTLELDQKLSNHPCLAFLDAFDRLTSPPGKMGYATLAYYLAAADKSVAARSVDKLALLIERNMLSTALLAEAILPFMLSDCIPSMRWTKQLQSLAGLGGAYKDAAREIMVSLMRFEKSSVPADIGGMLEVLFELLTDAQEPLRDASAIASLQNIEGSGKAAKYAARILALK